MLKNNLSSFNSILNTEGRTLDLVLSDIENVGVERGQCLLLDEDKYHSLPLELSFAVSQVEHPSESIGKPFLNSTKADFHLMYALFRQQSWKELYRKTRP